MDKIDLLSPKSKAEYILLLDEAIHLADELHSQLDRMDEIIKRRKDLSAE